MSPPTTDASFNLPMDADALSPPLPNPTASATPHHARAPHRRLRPSDLIRELESISSSPIDNTHVHRLLAKLPAAVADGVLSPRDASPIRQTCALMLQCGLSKSEPLPEPRGSEWNFVVSILNSDDDDDEIPDDKLSPFPANC